jgi:hypothetical protein
MSEFSECFQKGEKPTCIHWARDYLDFLCHGKNPLIQKCTGYQEPKKESVNDNKI